MKIPSWAKHVPIVRENEGIAASGKFVYITEANRTTQFVSHREAFKAITKILHDNYLRKGVNAVIVGMSRPHGIQWAVYCENTSTT